MSRRMEIELTSARPDGTWTWRAAGAREPRGVVEGGLLASNAKVGDILKVEADVDLEGISILSVVADRGHRTEPERLELLAPPQPFEPVVTTLATRSAQRSPAATRPSSSKRRRSWRRPPLKATTRAEQPRRQGSRARPTSRRATRAGRRRCDGHEYRRASGTTATPATNAHTPAAATSTARSSPRSRSPRRSACGPGARIARRCSRAFRPSRCRSRSSSSREVFPRCAKRSSRRTRR